ncbi:carbohydrate binding domain-containing protein [Nocardioides stalactiti]|uniref:carbohydrate binding domain-containing protein n=1 Tax=Nocardioides stalactiti TaxID=2755356 RepID=UPI00160294F0|nr:carbohydrate binding domain-containing protein [Nocardioides stalactiti]
MGRVLLRTAVLTLITPVLVAISVAPARAVSGDVFAAGVQYCADTYTDPRNHPNYFGSSPVTWVADINFPGDDGTVLYAPAAGSVQQVTTSPGSTWGNSVVWTSADGNEKLHLAHLSTVTKTGGVMGGDPIGTLGGTPNYSPHLHISRAVNGAPAPIVLSGVQLDPVVDPAVFGRWPCNGTTYTSAGPSGPPPNPDADGDGTFDASDACPSLKGWGRWQGCRANLLRNASLEEGNTSGWGGLEAGTNLAAYQDPAESKDHQWFGEANTNQAGGSIYQDIPVNPGAGSSFTFSIWVRSRTSTPATLRIVLWAVGGNQQSGQERVVVGRTWRLVEVPLDVREGSHTHLRAQVYIDTPGQNINFDGAQVQRNLLRNGSLEEGNTNGWGVLGPGTTNIAAYQDGSKAKEHDWYGETNVSEVNGSIYQDVAIAPQAGESYVFSMWVRSKTNAPVDVDVVLWAAGGNQQNGTESFKVGPKWRYVSVPLDVREGGHGHLRAQMYLKTPGRSVNFDGAFVGPSGLRNGSLEEGNANGWGVLGPGTTNIAAYQDRAQAKDHEWYGETNVSEPGGSIYQDVPLAPGAGQSFNYSMWVRSATTAPVTVELVLWAAGGNQQKGAKVVTVGHTWRLVSVPLDVREGGHAHLRAQLYLHTAGRSVDFDGAQLTARGDELDVTSPVAELGALPTFRLSRSVTTTWSSKDDVSGTASYDVRFRSATFDGVMSAYQYPDEWQRTTKRSVTTTGMPEGSTYCFSVRARDREGNLSGWTVDRCTAVALDDRALSGQGWTVGAGEAFYLGTIKSTKARDKTLRKPDARLSRVGVVATRCPGCGVVGVFVDGELVGRIDLYAPTRSTKRVVALPRFPYRTGTVVLKVLTRDKLVAIDGLGVSRL